MNQRTVHLQSRSEYAVAATGSGICTERVWYTRWWPESPDGMRSARPGSGRTLVLLLLIAIERRLKPFHGDPLFILADTCNDLKSGDDHGHSMLNFSGCEPHHIQRCPEQMTEYQEKGHGPNPAILIPPVVSAHGQHRPDSACTGSPPRKILGDPQQLLRAYEWNGRDVRPRQRRRRLPPSRE